MSTVNTIVTALDQAWASLGDVIQPATYRRTAPGAYDPATQGRVTTVTAKTVRAALLPYETGLENNVDIREGDRRCILRAKDLPFEPVAGDTVVHGADTWTVVRVGGDPRIFWDIMLRR